MSSKLREALKEAKCTLCRNQADLPVSAWVDVECAIRKIDAALAEPVLNCEVGTAEEQEVRFSAFCLAHRMQSERGCTVCPCYTPKKCPCEFAWAQMPYEEVKK